MKKYYRLIILLLPFVLTGCTTFVEIISNNLNPYKYKPNEAVIIVGALGDVQVGDVHTETSKGRVTFSVPTSLSRNIDAFAWNVKVGESFQVTGSQLNDGRSLIVKFRNKKTHKIKIEKEGVYYYGTIVSRKQGENVKALVTEKAFPKVIKVAKLKYKEVFKSLKPVNFK